MSRHKTYQLYLPAEAPVIAVIAPAFLLVLVYLPVILDCSALEMQDECPSSLRALVSTFADYVLRAIVRTHHPVLDWERSHVAHG